MHGVKMFETLIKEVKAENVGLLCLQSFFNLYEHKENFETFSCFSFSSDDKHKKSTFTDTSQQADPDKTPQIAASDLSSHYSPIKYRYMYLFFK